jgi:hypothetical protein
MPLALRDVVGVPAAGLVVVGPARAENTKNDRRDTMSDHRTEHGSDSSSASGN